MSMIQRLTVIAIIVACTVFYGVRAQSFAPAPGPTGPDCTTPVLNSTDCLSYVQAGSKTKVPDKACCPEVASLIENYPICLCKLISGAFSSYGIAIDTAKALKLPSVCHINTPPLSTCSALGIPVSSPSMAPGSSESPSSSGGPELPGSTSPSSPPSSSHGSPCFQDIELMLIASFSFIVVAIVGVF